MNSLKISLVLALVYFAGLPFALPSKQSITSTAKAEDQVLQLERDWLAASIKGDVASLRQIVADDFMGESRDGRLLNKDDVIPRQAGAGPPRQRHTPAEEWFPPWRERHRPSPRGRRDRSA